MTTDENFEHSLTNSDLITCPICEQRDRLKIRHIRQGKPESALGSYVGCERCDRWFHRPDIYTALAVQEWNLSAINILKKGGHTFEHERLYRLVKADQLARLRQEKAFERGQQYLKKHVAAKCPFNLGEQIRLLTYPGGIWAVVKVDAFYDYRDGPFWLIHISKIQKSGRLSDTHAHHKCIREFDADKVQPIPQFWEPTRWSQVVKGDECIIGNQLGRLTSVDRNRRRANVTRDDGTFEEVKSLNEIHVPVKRFDRKIC